jgi:rare lipoprotein A
MRSAVAVSIQRGLLACAMAAVLAACSSTKTRPGGFYQNDGPPDRVPADILRTPDAVPRVEPFHRFANRPYTALGRSYTPMTEDKPFRQRGLASWYGRQFHGNRTSSGEIYDMFAMTAAHPTLPIPSYVRVRHLRSGATVIVRVNDRGPFKPDRVIDLSYAAAVRLGYAAAGTAEVEVVRLTHADIRGGRVSAAEMFLAVDVERIGIAADIAGGQRRAPGSDE